MLNELKTNLEAIYQEKQEKVIPENIKKGITMFGVEGTLASMPYIVDTVVENVVFSNPTSSTYTFTLNANNYYESNNKGVASSYAMGRFTFNVVKEATISVDVINYAESGCDYGIIGKIDQTLNASTSVDSGAISLRSNNKADVQTIEIGTATVGTHYIDFKFRKDGSVNSYNDSLQIKLNIGAKIYLNYPVYYSQEDLIADTEQDIDTIAVIVNENMQVLSTWKWSGSAWSQTQNAYSNVRWYETESAFTSDTLNRSTINPYYGIIGKQNVLSPYYADRNYISNDLLIKKEVVFDNEITQTLYSKYENDGGGTGSWFVESIKLTPTSFEIDYSTYIGNYYDEEFDINRSGLHHIILNYVSNDGLVYTYNNAEHYYHLWNYGNGTTTYPEKDTQKEPYTDTIPETTIDDVDYFVITNCYLYLVMYGTIGVYYDEFSKFLFRYQNTFDGIKISTSTTAYSNYSNNLYGNKSKMAECLVYSGEDVVEGTLDKPLQFEPYDWDPDDGELESPQSKLEIYQRLKELLNSDELYENYTGEGSLYINISGYKYSEIPEFKLSPKITSFDIHSCPNLTTLPNMNYRNVNKLNIYNCDSLTTLPSTALSTITKIHFSQLPNLVIGTTDLTSLTLLDLDDYNNSGMVLDFTNATIPNLTKINLNYYDDIPTGIDTDNLVELRISQCANFEFGTKSFNSLKDITFYDHEGIMNISSWGNVDTTKLEEIKFEEYNSNIPTFTISSTLKSLYFSNADSLSTLPSGDYSGLEQFSIINCNNLVTIETLNTSSLTELDYNGTEDPETGEWINGNCINHNNNLVTIEGIDTSNVTRINYGFAWNSALVNIPVLDLSSIEYLNYAFGSCYNLSDTSLNNILASILTIPSTYAGGKSLSSQFGLNSTQVTKAKTLSNWSAVEALGWS